MLSLMLPYSMKRCVLGNCSMRCSTSCIHAVVCSGFFLTIEPQTKLVSGDQLPHIGPFPSWNFDPWNHHALIPTRK